MPHGSPMYSGICRSRTSPILLDIAPATAVTRKQTGRDRYERDVALLERVRASYQRQAQQPLGAHRRRAVKGCHRRRRREGGV